MQHSDTPSDFEKIITSGLSRRGFLAGMGVAALGTFLGANTLTQAFATGRSPLLGFKPVPTSTADTFVVPEGYSARPLLSWGDPLFPDAPGFDVDGSQPGAAQALQFGDNTDGMSLFPLSEDRALLAVNNESVSLSTMYPHRGSAITADDVIKSQHAQGVSVFEIRRDAAGFWQLDIRSRFNRRIHARTPIAISGPAAGHPLLRTEADPSGRSAIGTFGNCANGMTPWGTYLTCEENFQDYFAASAEDTELTTVQQRYEMSKKDDGTDWYLHDPRFDISRHPNEANRFGWIVEIDPHDPDSTPKKRTALGRFAHENAALAVNADGRIVVYMGDDTRGEHIYRFVSRDRYDQANPQANRDLLDHGTLYVARYHAEEGELQGKGEWIALNHGSNGLTPEAGFASQAEILINVRLAATAVGATTMDRPEWLAIHPHSGHVFCTLTNNHYRGVRENQPVNAANPRARNLYGQIIRWAPSNGDHCADDFDWDLFVIAGNPVVHAGTPYAGSDNITADNMFNSPDGLAFDADGRLWIETDGDFGNRGEYQGMGNNQMLCADPASGEIRRFATGPNGCEITGIAFSPDYRTLFMGVQHPGGDGTPSNFPGGGSSKPRSTIMMVRRNDGGVVGS